MFSFPLVHRALFAPTRGDRTSDDMVNISFCPLAGNLLYMSTLTCASSERASEHLCFSSLFAPAQTELMDPAPVIFTNDFVFMLGPWGHHKLLHSSKDRTEFNFLWDLNHFLFAYNIITFVFLVKGKQYGLKFYKGLELLIIWVSFQAIL